MFFLRVDQVQVVLVVVSLLLRDWTLWSDRVWIAEVWSGLIRFIRPRLAAEMWVFSTKRAFEFLMPLVLSILMVAEGLMKSSAVVG